jgi:Icc protein
VTETVRLLHLTDTHLHAHRDARMRGVKTFDTLQAIIEHVAGGQRKPDAVLATGDLVQDETRQGYDVFREAVEVLDAPVHCIPGNHDSQRIMEEALGQPPFHYCGHALYGNWSIVMLNTVIRLDDGGRLDENELTRLESLLQQHADRHIMICMHHHPYPMGSRWLDGVNMRNSDEFFAIVDQHTNVRCIVWGHVHQESDRDREGVRLLSTPSTGTQFLPNSDNFAVDKRPPGYRWINLMPDGSISTEVVWLA